MVQQGSELCVNHPAGSSPGPAGSQHTEHTHSSVKGLVCKSYTHSPVSLLLLVLPQETDFNHEGQSSECLHLTLLLSFFVSVCVCAV